MPHRADRLSTPRWGVALAAAVLLLLPRPAAAHEPDAAEGRWYKGNTHAHSFWSDGDDFPEMIVDWYKSHGYDFLAISDHNTLHNDTDKWVATGWVHQRAGGAPALEAYLDRFGDGWVQLRQDGVQKQVRLRPFADYRGLFEEPGEFVLMQAEEISDGFDGKPIHMNAVNLDEAIKPQGGTSVRDTMRRNLAAVQRWAEQAGKPVMVHLNHPNFGWAITAEDLAHVVEERFFEVYNGHPSINHLGDADRPGDERIWDIANTIRLSELRAAPLFGVGTDDSHRYHEGSNNPPGRGWIMVRAAELTPEALIAAMKRGDFYASSGVTLAEVRFDTEDRRLDIVIDAEPGVTYTTRFIGTRRGGSAEGAAHGEVGEVLAEVKGTRPSYRLSGDELYVRATVTSSKPHPRPSVPDQFTQAWTQPVGWRGPEIVEGVAGAGRPHAHGGATHSH